MTQLIYLNAFNQLSSLGSKRTFRVLRLFDNNAENAWFNINSDTLKKASLSPSASALLLHEKTMVNPEAEWQKLRSLNIKVIPHPSLYRGPNEENSNYPYLLTKIAQPPPILYLKGQLNPDPVLRLAVVGSRAATRYGERATMEIVRDLANANIEIVSGLALGIDTAAHQACLQTRTATIAVLANGLDEIYPRNNTLLADQIIGSGGGIISEFPLHTVPRKQNFPQRNRIISGLAQALLITQASLKSGSLITATHALEQNRDIFVVPGDIFLSSYAGTNNLIKQGARLVTQARDILLELGFSDSMAPATIQTKAIPGSPLQTQLYDILSHEPTLIDQLIKKIKLPAPEVNSAICLMEIKGLIRNIGGSQYIAIK